MQPALGMMGQQPAFVGQPALGMMNPAANLLELQKNASETNQRKLASRIYVGNGNRDL
jgi:hypothetical protein